MIAENIHSPLTALLAGLVTSAHCVGMCGPLICAASDRQRTGRSILFYHSGRLISYALAGGLGGWLGAEIAPWFNSVPAKWLPFAFALFFLAVALGWDKKIRMPRWLSKINARVARLSFRLPNPVASLSLGLGTPFLPCAPLYLALGVALFSGSFIHGAVLMSAFVVGTIPALALLQWNWSWLSMRLSPIRLRQLQRVFALTAVVLVLWRSMSGVTLLAARYCPFCH